MLLKVFLIVVYRFSVCFFLFPVLLLVGILIRIKMPDGPVILLKSE